MNVRSAIIAGRFFVFVGTVDALDPSPRFRQSEPYAWDPLASAQSVIPLGLHPKPALLGFQAQGLE